MPVTTRSKDRPVFMGTRSKTKQRLMKEKAEKAKKAESIKKKVKVKTAAKLSSALSGRNSYDNKAIALLQTLKSTKVTQKQIEDCRKCVNKKKDWDKCKKVCENVEEDDINKLTEEDIKKIKSKITKSKIKNNRFREPQLKF